MSDATKMTIETQKVLVRILDRISIARAAHRAHQERLDAAERERSEAWTEYHKTQKEVWDAEESLRAWSERL